MNYTEIQAVLAPILTALRHEETTAAACAENQEALVLFKQGLDHLLNRDERRAREAATAATTGPKESGE